MSDSSTTETGNIWPNPYLIALENKKKHELLHELGDGQPCLQCGDKCPGFSLHYWRKVCRNCRCGKEEHDVKEDYDPGVLRVGRLFDKYPGPVLKKPIKPKPSFEDLATDDQVPLKFDKLGRNYEWTPPGVSKDVATRYMSSLPPEKQPIEGTSGALYRKHQFEKQLPSHDLDPELCHDLPSNEAAMLNEFVDNVKIHVVGQGELLEQPKLEIYVRNREKECYECKEPLYVGEIAIFASRAGMEKCWHPGCFVCHKCKELLVDLIYFYKNENVFCGRHYADSVVPRCSACDEMIFAKEYTQAEGQSWHVKHFCCHNCDKALAGCQYVPRDSNPYCLECYDELFAKACLTCNSKIAPASQRITFNNCNYHATSECFHCANCKISLVKSRFVSRVPYVFCSRECREQFKS